MPVFSSEQAERSVQDFPPSVAVGYTNRDLKTNMLLEKGPQEKPDKASVT